MSMETLEINQFLLRSHHPEEVVDYITQVMAEHPVMDSLAVHREDFQQQVVVAEQVRQDLHKMAVMDYPAVLMEHQHIMVVEVALVEETVAL
jgi:hypothetical protein